MKAREGKEFDTAVFCYDDGASKLLKHVQPDISAPGLNTIAAYTEAKWPTNEGFDKQRIPFNSLFIRNFNVMSCRFRNCWPFYNSPYWSPATIKPAIMTTGI